MFGISEDTRRRILANVTEQRSVVRSAVQRAITNKQKDFRTCGTSTAKVPDGFFDPTTGTWEQSKRSKPPRLLVQVDNVSPLALRLEGEPDVIIGFYNLRTGNVGGLMVRTVPVLAVDGGFELLEEMEAIIVFYLSRSPASGTSSDSVHWDTRRRTLSHGQGDFPIASAAVFGLQDRNMPLANGCAASYGEFIDALVNRINDFI